MTRDDDRHWVLPESLTHSSICSGLPYSFSNLSIGAYLSIRYFLDCHQHFALEVCLLVKVERKCKIPYVAHKIIVDLFLVIDDFSSIFKYFCSFF
jgi:hypothetical protein